MDDEEYASQADEFIRENQRLSYSWLNEHQGRDHDVVRLEGVDIVNRVVLVALHCRPCHAANLYDWFQLGVTARQMPLEEPA